MLGGETTIRKCNYIRIVVGSPPVARTKNRLEQRRGNGASGPPSFCHPVVSRSAFMPDATIVTALKLILTWMTTRSHGNRGRENVEAWWIVSLRLRAVRDH